MNYLSVCSGIEAATVAWHSLGWKPFAFSEFERFPSEVLAHHYPNTPNFGDMTKFKEWPDATINVLVGGTPCQSFSVAGLRKGLDDPRGNLMLTYLAIASKYRPKWLVWENVPGVLSSNRGLDFATFLRGLGECGYGFAYRVLDAQYFGVPQRRRRVFVVGCLGDWRSAAAVLFERHSLQGHPTPRREQGKSITANVGKGIESSIDCGVELAGPLSARDYKDAGTDGINKNSAKMIPVTKNWPADISSTLDTTFGTKQGLEDQHVNAGCPMFVPAIAIQGNLIGRDSGGPQGVGASEGVMYTLTKADVHAVAQPIPINSMNAMRSPDADPSTGCGLGEEGEAMFTLTKGSHHAVAQPMAYNIAPGKGLLKDDIHITNADATKTLDAFGSNPAMHQGGAAIVHPTIIHGTQDPCVSDIAFAQGRNNGGENVMVQSMAVRRLTPMECERLQGFPDGYTDIKPKGKPTPDGPRYKALGNSMAVPVMAWIGKRIQMVEDL